MIYDIAIIGTGPTGLFVPFVAGMKKLSCIMFEALDFIGGQCTALYPEKPIYDIPSHPEITARDLILNLEKQNERFSPEIKLNETVLSYTKNDGIFTLSTSKNRSFHARSIIIATGGGRFTPNRPPLEKIDEFEGKTIFYSVPNKSIFANKKVAIAGGGDSAVDWAISLSKIAEKIYFIHRRDKFKASPESLQILDEFAFLGRLEFIIPFQLKSLKGENGVLKSLTVVNLQGDERELETDFLLPFFGLATDSSLIDIFGIEKENGLAKVEQSNMKTSKEGIYAVGDIACYNGKLKLILAGFSEVASAVYDIKKYLSPNEVERFQYSTSLFAK
jgi:thioredoxin reductase (NADPH)